MQGTGLEPEGDPQCNRIVLFIISDRVTHGVQCGLFIIEIDHYAKVYGYVCSDIIPQTTKKEWASRTGLIFSVSP